MKSCFIQGICFLTRHFFFIVERTLREQETQPGFSISVLNVVADNSQNSGVRLAGAVFFKNLIKRKWTNADGEYLLPEQDVEKIKSSIVDFLIQLPPNIQVQIGEAISIIADSDFPHRWESLVPHLVSKISGDFDTNNGVLTIAHSVFKRWRPLVRSNALFQEIQLVLDQFAEPFLKLLQLVDNELQKNVQNKQQTTTLLRTLDLLVKIFYDLNCQDIPEFFEDNLNDLFKVIYEYLVYFNPAIETDDDDESGPLEAVKSSICELLKLYTFRYIDVFGPLISKFVEATWNLLIKTSVKPKHDVLISKALSFLTSVAANPERAKMFVAEDTLQNIIKNIVLPNVTLQESDEEMFEDDPIEFIRRDLEGADSDTRRLAATDFLRELNEKDPAGVTGIVMNYVNQFLSAYASDNSQWKQKDTAIYLFSSIAVKGVVTNEGATSINPLVDVVAFFAQNVAHDLVKNDVHPILKVDSIKYIHTFRNQLTKEQLIDGFPLLSASLKSSEYVVYTYAAITIEKILAVRNRSDPNKTMFEKSDIGPVAQDLLSNLFALILKGTTPEKLAENEFLMKCVTRVLVSSRESIVPYATVLLNQVISIVGEISKNPSNPRFSHYTFEVIGAIVKYSAPTTGVSTLESIIFPPFLQILEQDISEFIPYVFQILAQLLHFYPDNQSLSNNYKILIRPLMAPSLWDLRGNIPGLVALLQSILRNGSQTVVETDNLLPILGVFQKLIASKANETYGLSLLQDIIYYISPGPLDQYSKQISILLLQRLQSSRTDKFVSGISRLIYFVSAAEKPGLGPDHVIQMFESAQNGIFGQIFKSLILPATLQTYGLVNRRIAAIGLTKILTQSNAFISGPYNSLWAETVIALSELLKTDLASTREDQDVSRELDQEEAASEFGSSYSKLTITSIPPTNPAPSVQDPKKFFIDQLNNVNSQTNGQLTKLLAELPAETKSNLTAIGYTFPY